MIGTKINILTVNSNPNSFSFVFPLLANKEGLLERGIKFSIFCSIKKSLCDSDVIFIDSKCFKYWWKDKEENVYDFLKTAKERASRVLWFDTSDSTGTPQFQVLPFVDGYYKNQILKDTKLYFTDFYRERIYSDYYHKKFGISDDAETGCEHKLEPQYADKIEVSWNPALNDHALYGNNYSLLGNIASRFRIYSPFKQKYNAKFIDIDKPRNTDITARMGFAHNRNFVKFHREMLLKELKKFNVPMDVITHKAYYQELKSAKLSVSPFGLGEITYRDFETILCGAVLVKPDMGHMDTWPDLYRDGQTYIKCNWDFSDLKETIGLLLDKEKKRRDIAAQAQDNYRYYLYGKGRSDFCDRINGIAGRNNE